MAKTNYIIQAKESSYMKETTQNPSDENTEMVEIKPETVTGKKTTFKEVVCPNVPTSYFKRAKRQRTK